MEESAMPKSEVELVICSRRMDCDPNIPCRKRQPFEFIERLKDGWSCDILPMSRQRCVAVDYIETDVN